jgi:ABC-2 type transport system ATP-binding protein
MLEAVNLLDRRQERVGSFSGGMRRRVELAKGMLTDPRLLILDEPSTGLDPAARIDMWAYLMRVRNEQGVTVLLTTHLMDEADRCDRLAVLDQGRLLACDSPSALKDRIGGDVITLATKQPAAVRIGLRDRLNVSDDQVKELDGTIRLERPRGHEFVPQLIEALPGLIDSVSVGRPTLEDVFIDLTGRTLHGED